MVHRSLIHLTVVLAFLADRGQAGNVLVVAPSGSPFTTAQSAVDAALDGDTLLIRPGSNYAGFTITNRSLTVIGDAAGSVVFVSQVRVESLAAGKVVLLSNLALTTGAGPFNDGLLRCANNDGLVWLERIQVRSLLSAASGAGAQFSSCANVIAAGCEFEGAFPTGPFPAKPGDGLVVENSVVGLYACSARGARGSNGFLTGGSSWINGLPGAPGMRARGASLIVCASGLFQGGAGGQGVPANCGFGQWNGFTGYQGGPGIAVEGTSAVHRLGASLLGGAGGPGGPPCGTFAGGAVGLPGPVATGTLRPLLPGSPHGFTAPTQVRTGALLDMSVSDTESVVGEQVGLRSTETPLALFSFAPPGFYTFPADARIVRMGTVGFGAGVSLQIIAPVLPPGSLARTLFLQSQFVDLNGLQWLGRPSALVVLDPSL